MLNNLLSAWPEKKVLLILLLGRFPKYKREPVGEEASLGEGTSSNLPSPKKNLVEAGQGLILF